MILSALRRLARKPLSLVLVGVLVAIVAVAAVALTVSPDLRSAVAGGTGGALSGTANPGAKNLPANHPSITGSIIPAKRISGPTIQGCRQCHES